MNRFDGNCINDTIYNFERSCTKYHDLSNIIPCKIIHLVAILQLKRGLGKDPMNDISHSMLCLTLICLKFLYQIMT